METPQNDPPNLAPTEPAQNNLQPAAPAAPPPAAIIVKEGKTQRELELEAQLEDKNKTIKDRELSLAQVLDENHRLKQPPPPAPRAPKPKKSCLEAFLAGED